jgi:predicted MFS family arabinose efflux permease
LLSRFKLLGNRSYRLVFIGLTVSSLGDSMMPVALAFGILSDGGRAIDLAYVFGAQEVTALLFYLLGGVAGDRYSRKLVMISADSVRAVSQLLLGVLLIEGHAPIAALAACTAVQGLAGGFFTPAGDGLVPSLVEPERLQEANVLQGIGSNAATILGPALAGILVVTAGGGWAIVVNGVTFAVNAAMLSFVSVRKGARPEAEQRVGVFRQLRDGWSAFTSMRWYVILVGCFAGFNFFMGVFLTLGPVIAKQDLGGAKAWAAMMTAGAVGSVIGGLTLMRLTPRHPLRAGRLLGLPFAFMLGLVALTLPVAALCAYSVVACACLLPGMTLTFSSIQRAVPANVLSRVISYDYFFSFLTLPLGYVAGGLLGSAVNPRVVLGGASAGLIAITLLGALVPAIWRFTLSEVPSPAAADAQVAPSR